MTTDIRAGDVRLLSRYEAQQRVLELLESEERLCARIRELEAERMTRKEVMDVIGCLRYVADRMIALGGHIDAESVATRRALADRLAARLYGVAT